jgi:hypothetical protein
MRTVLRHAIGKSTLKEGFAVPRDYEEWIHAPARGESREIRLIFEGAEIPATLRRIDNDKGSVQVKYENKACEPFRAWLSSVFVATMTGPCGEYFEIDKVDNDLFRVTPFPTNLTSGPRLQIERWLFHGGAESLLEQDPIAEIPAVVRTVPFENREGVQVEVEFGNARTYYQDFVKFLLGNHYGNADIGVLIVPTGAFARHLCEMGRLRAVDKGKRYYSGMIDFDKVQREFQHLKFMMAMPIAVAGIGSIGLDQHAA